MAKYCLPKSEVEKFREARKNGIVSYTKLKAMSSEQRRVLFKDLLGEVNAEPVNLAFESKLLLKDQVIGFRNFLNDIEGLNQGDKLDLVDQIDRMDKILNPKDKQSFLEDIAKKKMKTPLTDVEAREIFDMSQEAMKLREKAKSDVDNRELWTDYGVAKYLLNRKINELKGDTDPWWIVNARRLGAVWNLPRHFGSTGDFSAGGIQLGPSITRKEWWKGQLKQFKYFSKEDAYIRLQGEILGSPLYNAYKSSGVGMTDITNDLSTNEEVIYSNLLEVANEYAKKGVNKALSAVSGGRITEGAPNTIRAFDRAYTGYINYVRWNLFQSLYNDAKLRGEDVSVGSDVLKDLGKRINVMTGYGSIGKEDTLRNAAPILNVIFWSTRKLVADFQYFDPRLYLTGSPTAKKFALKRLASSAALMGTIWGLAELMGLDPDLNPISTTFGSFNINGTRYYPPMAIPLQVIRLLSRVYTGETVNLSGKTTKVGEGFPTKNRVDDIIEPYFRSKFAPVTSFFYDMGKGSSFLGQPFSVTEGIQDRMMMMGLDSFVDIVTNDQELTPSDLFAISSLFGVKTLTVSYMTRQGMNVWGTPESSRLSFTEDDSTDEALDKLLEEAGTPLNFPYRSYNGIKLTDTQYETYIRDSGRWIKTLLVEKALNNPEWDELPKETRALYIDSWVKGIRKNVMSRIMIEGQKNPGEIDETGLGVNDLLSRSLEKKRTNRTGVER
jgi:hypothetical protein